MLNLNDIIIHNDYTIYPQCFQGETIQLLKLIYSKSYPFLCRILRLKNTFRDITDRRIDIFYCVLYHKNSEYQHLIVHKINKTKELFCVKQKKWKYFL